MLRVLRHFRDAGGEAAAAPLERGRLRLAERGGERTEANYRPLPPAE